MKDSSYSSEKAALRRHFSRLRDSLTPEEVESRSLALCARLATWPPLADASTVLAYLAMRSELDLRPLFNLLPDVHWALPRVAGTRLAIHPYCEKRLVWHRFGMLEPEQGLPIIQPQEIDVVLVPGLAFDRQGCRLGYGGGYYDRFLSTTPAMRVGIAWDSCVADEIPCTHLDQRMDWLATPTRVFHCVSENGNAPAYA